MNGRLKTLFESGLRNPRYAYSSVLGKIKRGLKLDYEFMDGTSFLPETVRIDTTYKCNFYQLVVDLVNSGL